MLSALDILAPGRTPGQRRRAIQRTWSDEERARRACVAGMVEWRVPECSVIISQTVLDEEDRTATQTINRWRKSVARTRHAAELCMQLEADAIEPCSVTVSG